MKRIAIIGAGFVAKFHLRALQSVRGAEVVAVHALSGAIGLANLAHELGVGNPTVCDSVADACKMADIIGIFVPNFVREQVVKEIVNSRAPVAVVAEKPLARNVAEANRILDLIGQRCIPNAYFENQIHMPAIAAARTQLAGLMKRMGPVNLVRSAEEHGGPHEPWFWNPTLQGGGVWCDMGCHSIAVGEDLAAATPGGQLTPLRVSATLGLLKWKHEPWLGKLKDRGVDYTKTPAEDFAQVSFTFRNADGREVVVLATDSWMYESPGLRLQMEAMGPGYALGVNTLQCPAGIFISDAAAESASDTELALEKSQASRGQLIVQPDEAALYGYVNEWRDALAAFERGKDGLLNFAYGARVVKLVMAAYWAHEKGRTINLDEGRFLNSQELADYVPKIQQGLGGLVL